MRNVRYCILGAGPSGLAFAAALKKGGCDSFLLLEKEKEAGGLCRSTMIDGSPLDIGGGHFLDPRRHRVTEFLFQFMPRDEWREYQRISTIRIRGLEIGHPLEGNLWQMPIIDQIDFLESIARAGCIQGTPEPPTFEEWILWKFGNRIAKEYMLPYNRKIWCWPLSDLGKYWLHKLPSVSFRETLQSCLNRTSGGTLPAHGQFLYPRAYGYGEVWRRIAVSLGDRFLPSYNLKEINLKDRIIDRTIKADVIVNTIPWTIWCQLTELPITIRKAVGNCIFTSIYVDYHSENLASSAHWIYEPQEEISYHRLLLRQNFCEGAHGHWTETNAKRAKDTSKTRFINEFAYPVNTLGKPEAIKTIIGWAREHRIIGIGRWGTWEHINSDVAVDLALKAAEECLGS